MPPVPRSSTHGLRSVTSSRSRATITFDLGRIAKKLSVEHTDKRYKRVGNKLTWSRRDFEPIKEDDMAFVWMDKKFKS
jgi:hypothetical protein